MKKIFIYCAAIVSLVAFSNCNGTTAKSDSTEKSELENVEETATETVTSVFSVEASCGMCKTRIEDAAKAIDGVEFAEYNLDTKELTVKIDTELTTTDAVLQAVADAGHDNEKFKATDESYKALPGCCKYRE